MTGCRNRWCRSDATLDDLAEVLSLLMPSGRKEAVLCLKPGRTPWVEVLFVWEEADGRPVPDCYSVTDVTVRTMAVGGWLTAAPMAESGEQRFVLNAIGQSAWWDIADKLEEEYGDPERYLRLLLRRYGVRF